MTLNIAVARPIPNASVRTATVAKPGDLRNCRKAKRRSWRNVSMGTPQHGIVGVIDGRNGGLVPGSPEEFHHRDREGVEYREFPGVPAKGIGWSTASAVQDSFF